MRGILTARWRLRRKYLTTIAGVAVLATPAVAEIKADAIRIGVLTDMSGIFATAPSKRRKWPRKSSETRSMASRFRS